MQIDEILNQRELTHGKFKDQARIAQGLKFELGDLLNLTPTQREALEMITHKIARIVAGNPNCKDHWDDIAGYALLVSKELNDG